jgi:hypothetical protein
MSIDTTTKTTTTRRLTIETLAMLRLFIGPEQMAIVQSGMQGEERDFFIDKLAELGELIAGMPQTYGTEGQGGQAIAHLHYFKGNGDWYITERDIGDANDSDPGAQHQAHGLAFLFAEDPDGEQGYISLVKLMRHGVELDLHFAPRTLAAVRQERRS